MTIDLPPPINPRGDITPNPSAGTQPTSPSATLHVLGDEGENMTEQSTISDYQAVGGGPAVKAVVEDFYARVLHDPQLAPFFIGVDLPRLKRHQALLVTKVLGGPDGYTGRSLRRRAQWHGHHGRGLPARARVTWAPPCSRPVSPRRSSTGRRPSSSRPSRRSSPGSDPAANGRRVIRGRSTCEAVTFRLAPHLDRPPEVLACPSPTSSSPPSGIIWPSRGTRCAGCASTPPG